jgi:hypothetical protein
MEVAVAPNPSNSHFMLNIESEDNSERIIMKVVDVWGRVVETRNNVTAHQPIRIGDNLKPGIYFVQLQQGAEITQIKLLKIK